jgi:hypothetical protein
MTPKLLPRIKGYCKDCDCLLTIQIADRSIAVCMKPWKLYNFYGEHGGGEKKLIENIDEEYCSGFEPIKEKCK